jgi:hypothetical protein
VKLKSSSEQKHQQEEGWKLKVSTEQKLEREKGVKAKSFD